MLYLKRLEGILRNGQPIRPVSVSAEVGDLSKIESVQREEQEWVARGWQDVENWGSALPTRMLSDCVWMLGKHMNASDHRRGS